jgi:hypothetical protein
MLPVMVNDPNAIRIDCAVQNCPGIERGSIFQTIPMQKMPCNMVHPTQ